MSYDSNIIPEDPKTEIINSETDAENVETEQIPKSDTYIENMDLRNFGFENKDSQLYVYDKVTKNFTPLLNNGGSVLETNAGRGDFGEYLKENFNIKAYYGHDIRSMFGDHILGGYLGDITIPSDIDIVYHNFTLQNSVPIMLIGDEATPIELFKYLSNEWDLITENSVSYSIFNLSLTSDDEKELLVEILNYCSEMDTNISLDYYGETKLVSIIIIH